MDLNKLSYKTYGNLVISILIIFGIVFTLFPFNFANFNFKNAVISFFIYIMMIPIYLISRQLYGYPIHLVGLNKCFIFTTSFYFILDVLIFLSIKYMGYLSSIILGVGITCLSTYFTSELTNIKEEKGKLFWGFKNNGEPSKYQKLIDYIKLNAITDEYIEAEMLLNKAISPQQFIIYKRIIKEGNSWSKVEEELDVNRLFISKTLDQCYFYMIGRLRI